MNTSTTATKPSPPRSPAMATKRLDLRATAQPPQGPRKYNVQSNWTPKSESKVRIMGIPKHCWTKDIYTTMSHFGTVIRVEMEVRIHGNNAWVEFQ